MYFDNPKRKATQGVSDIHESSRSAVTVPNSVSWAAAHPFQGGGVSPK